MGDMLLNLLFHPVVLAILFFLTGVSITRGMVQWLVFPLTRRRFPGVVDVLLKRKSPRLFSLLVGIFFSSVYWVVVSLSLPSVYWVKVGGGVLDILLMVLFFLWLVSLLDSAHDIYLKRPMALQVPLNSYLQAVKLVLFLVFSLVGGASLFNLDPAYIVTMLGGSAVVVSLVFKDPILSLVASLQVAANRMVSIGDWIEVPEYFANGRVLEINLTSVKVEGADRAITTLPTYALTTQSVKNWSPTIQKKQRRFSRTIIIDINSIQLYKPEESARLVHLPLAAEFLDRLNSTVGEDAPALQPSTNLGIYLGYATEWLRRQPFVSQDMPAAAIQLPMTTSGLPVEFAGFLTEVDYPVFETLQSEITLQMLAVLPFFQLRVFQTPAGNFSG